MKGTFDSDTSHWDSAVAQLEETLIKYEKRKSNNDATDRRRQHRGRPLSKTNGSCKRNKPLSATVYPPIDAAGLHDVINQFTGLAYPIPSLPREVCVMEYCIRLFLSGIIFFFKVVAGVLTRIGSALPQYCSEQLHAAYCRLVCLLVGKQQVRI